MCEWEGGCPHVTLNPHLIIAGLGPYWFLPGQPKHELCIFSLFHHTTPLTPRLNHLEQYEHQQYPEERVPGSTKTASHGTECSREHSSWGLSAFVEE